VYLGVGQDLSASVQPVGKPAWPCRSLRWRPSSGARLGRNAPVPAVDSTLSDHGSHGERAHCRRSARRDYASTVGRPPRISGQSVHSRCTTGLLPTSGDTAIRPPACAHSVMANRVFRARAAVLSWCSLVRGGHHPGLQKCRRMYAGVLPRVEHLHGRFWGGRPLGVEHPLWSGSVGFCACWLFCLGDCCGHAGRPCCGRSHQDDTDGEDWTRWDGWRVMRRW